jgi:hypothetical protein
MQSTILGYEEVQILAVGTMVQIRDKWYEVVGTTTESVKAGQFTTFATLQPIDGEGNYLDEPEVTVNLDTVDVKV